MLIFLLFSFLAINIKFNSFHDPKQNTLLLTTILILILTTISATQIEIEILLNQ